MFRFKNNPLMFAMVMALALSASPAFAAGGGSGGSDDLAVDRPGQTEFKAGKDLIKQERFAEAVEQLKKAVAQQPDNANYLTELGFATRKSGQRDASFGYYLAALEIDPDHIGALNYLGMLYVETERPHKAEELLQKIDDACFFTCEEYTTLKSAIESGDTSAY